MFRLAVLGPILAGGFGVARQCVECNRRQSRHDHPRCSGFGAGCLGYVPMTAPAEASDHEVGWSEDPAAVTGAR